MANEVRLDTWTKPRDVKLEDLPREALHALASAGNLDAASVLVSRRL